MKILHVIPSIGPIRGGPSRAVLDMCVGLAQAGFDVTLATTDDNGFECLSVALEMPIDQNGYKVFYFRRSTKAYTVSWRFVVWLARHIQDYDLVHIHAVFSFLPVVAGMFSRALRVPYVMTPHGLLLSWGLRAKSKTVKQVSYRFLEKPLLNHSEFIHATSHYEAKELIDLGVKKPIETIGLGITLPSHIDKKADTNGSIRFLFLGRLHKIKGLDLLLPAYVQVRLNLSESTLMLAGDGDEDYKIELSHEIERLHLSDSIQMIGFVEGQAKWDLIGRADIVVMPSYSESFGLVAVEALASGTPIILTDQVAISHEVQLSGGGIVVPCNINDLSQAMISLALDRERRSEMSEYGRRYAERYFQISSSITQFASLYKNTLLVERA